jgi:hypothetical protein
MTICLLKIIAGWSRSYNSLNLILPAATGDMRLLEENIAAGVDS